MRLMLAAVFMSEHYFFLCRHLHFTPWRTSLKHRNTIPHPSWEQPLLWTCTVAKNSNQLQGTPWPKAGAQGDYSCWAADPPFPATQTALCSKESKPISKETKPIRKEELHWLLFSEMWVLLWSWQSLKDAFPRVQPLWPSLGESMEGLDSWLLVSRVELIEEIITDHF